MSISIHALREEGDIHWRAAHRHQCISIHALREEGDTTTLPSASRCWKFLSTPSARRATYNFHHTTQNKLFLSTPSARRATISPAKRACTMGYFYPRPPRGGRLEDLYNALLQQDISIHALREEGDLF